MNTDIRIEVSFRGHRKRKKLNMILGPGATDYLLDLWIGVAINKPSGVLTGWDEMDIALEAGWDGDAGKFVAALKDSRFLDIDAAGTYSLHNWQKRQPWAANHEARSLSASKNQVKRWCMREISTKKERERFSKWYKSYTFQKGDSTARILSVYESYLNGNTPPPSPLPSPTPLPSPSPKEEEGDSDENSTPEKEESEQLYPDSVSGPVLPDLSVLQEELFQLLWKAYPKQINEAEARWAFAELNPNQDQVVNKIIPSIQEHRKHAWSELKYIPQLSTFLSKRKYENNLELNGELGEETPDGTVPIKPRTVRDARILANDQMADMILTERKNEQTVDDSETAHYESGQDGVGKSQLPLS